MQTTKDNKANDVKAIHLFSKIDGNGEYRLKITTCYKDGQIKQNATSININQNDIGKEPILQDLTDYQDKIKFDVHMPVRGQHFQLPSETRSKIEKSLRAA